MLNNKTNYELPATAAAVVVFGGMFVAVWVVMYVARFVL